MAQYKGAAAEAIRANQLMKKRQKEQEELEVRKKKIEEDLKIGSITNKFAAHYDAIEQKLKSDTVGKLRILPGFLRVISFCYPMLSCFCFEWLT